MNLKINKGIYSNLILLAKENCELMIEKLKTDWFIDFFQTCPNLTEFC